ncbi:MAG: transglutaminase domain-containing protein [Candidatus Woesearchaeota archaeon]|nr:MAG: transglutaminase domain-containing protein [Candidatus Woesearchaeota archaeon]
MNTEHWLQEGPQTKITPAIREFAARIPGTPVPEDIQEFAPELVLAYQTAEAIRTLAQVENDKTLLAKIFRRRTADEIVRSFIYGTCSDYAVTFRALMVAQGVPTSYVEAISVGMLKNNLWFTHAENQVYTQEGPVVFSPWYRTHHRHNGASLDDLDYVPIKEGLDSHDVGIYNWMDRKPFVEKHKEEIKRKLAQLRSPTSDQPK